MHSPTLPYAGRKRDGGIFRLNRGVYTPPQSSAIAYLHPAAARTR